MGRRAACAAAAAAVALALAHLLPLAMAQPSLIMDKAEYVIAQYVVVYARVQASLQGGKPVLELVLSPNCTRLSEAATYMVTLAEDVRGEVTIGYDKLCAVLLRLPDGTLLPPTLQEVPRMGVLRLTYYYPVAHAVVELVLLVKEIRVSVRAPAGLNVEVGGERCTTPCTATVVLEKPSASYELGVAVDQGLIKWNYVLARSGLQAVGGSPAPTLYAAALILGVAAGYAACARGGKLTPSPSHRGA